MYNTITITLLDNFLLNTVLLAEEKRINPVGGGWGGEGGGGGEGGLEKGVREKVGGERQTTRL